MWDARPPPAEQDKADPQRLTRAALCSRATPGTSLSSPQPEYSVPPVPPSLVNKHGGTPRQFKEEYCKEKDFIIFDFFCVYIFKTLVMVVTQ